MSLQAHEFQFVMGRQMREEIKGLDLYKDVGSMSGSIVKILFLLSPILKLGHKWGKQQESKYQYVSGDPDEKREFVHVYFPAEMYRQLKLMHQDLNVYSIAQIVRRVLWFYLGLVCVYGDDVKKILQLLYTQWNKEQKKMLQSRYNEKVGIWDMLTQDLF